ncbi:MAG: hypothetical protein B7X06_01730, partial [Verrucomicrobia bacterium 21-51-4]
MPHNDARHASNSSRGNGYGYGAYGAGYGGYGYGYGPGVDVDSQGKPRRGFREYLMILRERLWTFVAVALTIFLAVGIYTFNATRLYTASAVVQVLREPMNALGGQDILKEEIRSYEDLNTQIKILESMAVVDAVAERLRGVDLRRLMEPYTTDLKAPPQGVLSANREIRPIRSSLLIAVEFKHPDPRVSSQIANLFAEEYINYNLRLNIENSMKAVEDLKARAAQQRAVVESLETKLAEYKEKYHSISVEEREDIDLQELMALNDIATRNKNALDVSRGHWEQVQRQEAENKPLWELPFISQLPLVSSLRTELSNEQINVATLKQRYLPAHPKMIEAQEAMAQTQAELNKALQSAVQEMHANYITCQKNYDQTMQRLSGKEADIIKLSKMKVEFNSIKTDLEVNRSLHAAMVMRLNSEMAQVSLKNPSARIIDKAVPPVFPSSPKIFTNIFLGFVGGSVVGLALVLLMAFLDDRIKSPFDIESTLGLPLAGIVGRLGHLDAKQKARCVANNEDRRATESFRAIHSYLKLNDAARNAKVLLTTSTVPGEGKSFISTNLAYTFASHGERVVLIDCDLRMPNVGKSLGLPNTLGLQQVLEGTKTLEEATHYNVFPNLDVISSGGHSSKSTQLLHGDVFSKTLELLKTRYDRVFIDSPPVAAVSDAFDI